MLHTTQNLPRMPGGIASHGDNWTAGFAAPVYGGLLLGEVDNFFDAENRPIGEMRADPQITAMARTDYRSCRYAGSRGAMKLPMNVSALRQVTQNWPAILGVIQHLRRRVAREPSDELPMFECARVAVAGLCIPSYLILSSAANEAEYSVPAYISASHKMFAGIFGLCKNYIVTQVAAGFSVDQMTATPARLHQFAENSGMLVGKSGREVCAGAPTMIDEALTLLVSGRSCARPDAAPIEDLIPCAKTFIDYCTAVADMNFCILAVAVRSLISLQQIRHQFVREAERAVACGKDIDKIRRCFEASVDLEPRLFGAKKIPGRSLDTGTARALVDGLASLVSDQRKQFVRGSLFAHDSMSRPGSDSLRDWINSAVHIKGDWTDDGVNEISAAFADCLSFERDACRIFGELQRAIHCALDIERNTSVEVSVLERLFGDLPTSLMKEAFDLDIVGTADGWELKSGSMSLRLES